MRIATVATAALLALAPGAAPAAEPVALTAADKVKVFATYYGAGDKTKPIVLLFHQAGANSAEYASIAPRLNRLGFNALAVDQRSGGSAFGRANKTVKVLGHSKGYRAALPDFQAALDWARAHRATRIIVCGSSYSASLVFLLATDNPGKIAALMAFSPGEYLGGSHVVRDAAAKLKNVAVFVSSANDSGEIAAPAPSSIPCRARRKRNSCPSTHHTAPLHYVLTPTRRATRKSGPRSNVSSRRCAKAPVASCQEWRGFAACRRGLPHRTGAASPNS